MAIRSLKKPDFKGDNKYDFILSMDVARSDKDSNNHSSIAVLKVYRGKNGRITQIRLVNIINLPNGLNFSAQAIELKKIKKQYNAKAVVVDGNGLGSGVIDELLQESFDPDTGDSLGCWGTTNTEQQPELNESEDILFNLHSQGINNDIIVNFIDMIESKKLSLLEKKQNSDYDIGDDDAYNGIIPHLQTDLLLEEVANLKLKRLPSGKYTVEQVTKKINKDRYSAVAYGLWYIKNFEDNTEDSEDYEFGFFFN
jgi:hypothetical protein